MRFALLAELCESEDGAHLRGEEDDADADENAEALRREVRPRARDDERHDERERDEHEGHDEQPELVAGQRQRHAADATTGSRNLASPTPGRGGTPRMRGGMPPEAGFAGWEARSGPACHGLKKGAHGGNMVPP